MRDDGAGRLQPGPGGAHLDQRLRRPAVRVGEGAPSEVLTCFTDITASKRVEAALRESEERYQRITEGLTDYLYTVDVSDGRAVSTVHSQACEVVTGYAREEFARIPFSG